MNMLAAYVVCIARRAGARAYACTVFSGPIMNDQTGSESPRGIASVYLWPHDQSTMI